MTLFGDAPTDALLPITVATEYQDRVPFHHRATLDVENSILPVPDRWKNPIWNSPAMKKRQARKILNQVLQQNNPVNLADGRRASKRAIRRAKGSDPDLLADSTPQELKRMAGLARRFDRARRRQKQISNRNFKRVAHSRARRAPVGAAASR